MNKRTNIFERYEDRFVYRDKLRVIILSIAISLIAAQLIYDGKLSISNIVELALLLLSYKLIVIYRIQFYKRYGIILKMKCEHDQSKRVVTEVLHGFVHTDDDPGTGKDTWQNFATLTWDEHIREDIHDIRY